MCRASGLCPQEAFDRVNELLKERYHDWYIAHAALPQWGEDIDTQVQKYIRGVHETMLANLNFRYAFFLKCILLADLLLSFYSERYFGDRRHLTRKDRKVLVKGTPVALLAAVSS